MTLILEKIQYSIYSTKKKRIIYSHYNKSANSKLVVESLDDLIGMNDFKCIKNIEGTPYLATAVTSAYTGWTFINLTPVNYLTSSIDTSKKVAILFCAILTIFGIMISTTISRDICKPVAR